MVKLGFTGVYFFLLFALKHRLWVLIRTASVKKMINTAWACLRNGLIGCSQEMSLVWSLMCYFPSFRFGFENLLTAFLTLWLVQVGYLAKELALITDKLPQGLALEHCG